MYKLKIITLIVLIVLYSLKLIKLVFNLENLRGSIFNFPTKRGDLIGYCFGYIVLFISLLILLLDEDK